VLRTGGKNCGIYQLSKIIADHVALQHSHRFSNSGQCVQREYNFNEMAR
jgi:hypothetical protein